MADVPIGNLVVNLKYNGTEFHEGIQATKREIKKLSTTLKTAKAETDLYGKGTESATKQLRVMKDLFNQHNHHIKQQQEQYGRLQEKMNKYDEEVEKGIITEKEANKLKDQTAKKMQKVEDEIAKSAGKMAKLKESYLELSKEQYLANSRLATWSDKITEVGAKQEQLGRKIGDFGNKLTLLSGAIGATGGLALREAIKFESSFAGVKKTVEGTKFEFDELSNSIRELAKTIPVGVNELNEIAESAGQLGINKENLLGFTETMAKLGASTNMSSTEAANALARLANITGLPQEKIGNLGSAIVGLGNNFATTESEIVDMSLGLAGAGAQLGLTEADVLGIATALSSLGIASERGGSSMSKALIKMSTAANNGGDELEDFANIAGVTSEQFANMFKSNPTQALALFVEGLGSASEKGTTAVAMLEDMGIKEIRLRDTLLRAGSANELFTRAIRESNEAFNENTALNEEYAKRAETFESKLTVFKNKLVDVAISMGNELLPTMTEVLENSEPFVHSISNAVKWFARLDNSTKSLIGKLGMLVFAGGPVISFLGNVIYTGGLAKQAIGGLGDTFAGKLLNRAVKKGLGDIAGEVAGVGTKAVLTQGTVSGLGGMLAGLGSVIPILAGVTVAVGAGYAAWKIWGEKAWQAREQVAKFGTTIDKEVAPHLESFKDSIEDLGLVMDGSMGLDKPVEAINGMFRSINDTAKERIAELESDFAKLPVNVQKVVTKGFDDKKNVFLGYQKQAEEVQESIKKVYQKASDERRELTDQELAYIQSQTEKLKHIMADLSTKSAEDSAKVFDNLSTSVEKMTSSQLTKVKKNLEKENVAIKKAHEERKKILEEQFTNQTISYREYQKGLQLIDEERRTALLNNAVKLKAIWEENARRAGQTVKETKQQVERSLAEMGLAYDEVVEHAEKLAKVTEETSKWIAEDYDDMTENVKKANETWNNLVLEDKEGRLKSNPTEFLGELMKSKEGWEKLVFIIKHANISTNAKETIKEALIANGQWENLDPQTKFYLTETNSNKTLDQILNDNMTWSTLTYEQKTIILNSTIPERQKELLLFNGKWDNTEFKEKLIKILTTSENAEREIDGLLRTYNIGYDTATRKPINFRTKTNAKDNTPSVRSWNDYVKNAQDKTVTFTTNYLSKYTKLKYAKGTNWHRGGTAVLGDGGRREPFLTPQGDFGISPAVDTLYDLPQGTKVWSSITKFRSQAGSDRRLAPYLANLPHFATGTDQSFLDEVRVPNVFSQNESSRTITFERKDNGMEKVVSLLQAILSTQNRPVILDSGLLVGGIADKMDEYFGEELV